MNELKYKVGLSALWFFELIAFLYYRSLAIKQNAYNASLLKVEELIGYIVIILIFAILSLILKQKNNRQTNIVAGFIVAGVQLLVLIDGATSYPSAGFNLVTIVTIVFMALVVWLAKSWSIKNT